MQSEAPLLAIESCAISNVALQSQSVHHGAACNGYIPSCYISIMSFTIQVEYVLYPQVPCTLAATLNSHLKSESGPGKGNTPLPDILFEDVICNLPGHIAGKLKAWFCTACLELQNKLLDAFKSIFRAPDADLLVTFAWL